MLGPFVRGALLGLALLPSPALAQTHTQCLLPQREVLWAGTFGQGLLRSGDGGRTWRAGGLPTDVTRVLALAALQRSLFVGTEAQGLWRSDDGGQHWARWDTGLPNTATIQALLADRRGQMWAGTADEGLVTRASNEKAWRHVPSWSSPAAVGLIAAPGDELLVGTLGDGLWQSKNHGLSWTRCPGIPTTFRAQIIARAPEGRAVVGNSTGELYALDQGASTWALITKAYIGGALYQIEVLPGGRVVGTSNFGLIALSPDGSRWIKVESLERLPGLGSVLWRAEDGSLRLAGRA